MSDSMADCGFDSVNRYDRHAVLDLFAGTGVGVACRSLGAKEYGVEIMPEAIASREANGMETPYEDAWEADLAGDLNFDTIWASPPCQTFSMAGNGAGRKALTEVLDLVQRQVWRSIEALKREAAELGDDRTGLVLTPLHYAWRYRPTYIALEQVPPVLPVWEAMAVQLRAMGYSAWTGKLSAEQYGVPQVRTRAFLIARSDGIAASPPVPTHSKFHPRTPDRLDPGLRKWVSMAEAIEWGFNNRPSYTVCGASSNAIGDSEWGGASVRKVMRDAAVSGDESVWVANPSVTGVTNSGNVRITEGEAATLQSYPVIEWRGSRKKIHLQIANAVPPLLARAVLMALWAGADCGR